MSRDRREPTPDELAELPRELAELLDAERDAIAPGAALARVWSRTAAATGAGGGPGGDPNGQGGAGTHGGSGGLGSGAGAKLVGFVATPAGKLLATAMLVVGVARGGVYAMKRAPDATTPVAWTTALGPAASAPPPRVPLSMPGQDPTAPAPALEEPPTVDVADLPSVPAARAPASLRPASSSLVDERPLLDEARAALARDDGPEALRWTQLHARRFATGQLVEEREALAVQSLVLAHRYDEARARGARFRSVWGQSLFLPAVEASLRSIPVGPND